MLLSNCIRIFLFSVPPISSTLSVLSVDLLSSKTGQNRREHHTDLFYGDELIIRRGQAFQMELELCRPFNQDRDKLYLDLKTELAPKVSKETHVIIKLVRELVNDCWEAKIVEQKGNKVKLSVNSPPNAVIGQYRLVVSTCSSKGEAAATSFNPNKTIVMLFNPWCKGDSVFLDDEEKRKEYVLNDSGRIYTGNRNQIGFCTWIFGQFQKGILEASMFLLEKNRGKHLETSDPVNVARVISAMINSNDDSGVLEGRWSGDYSGGKSPTLWGGSVDILKKYHASNGTSVKYGQCWVFSGVATTVFRCLGIPTRSVSNFQSAHDNDGSLTTDFYYEGMKPLHHRNDSIWNFHVWNDCWMARPDLPAGMGGWQAVDATPQERSQSIFCCGPASVTAIRLGQVNLNYDAGFVFAEVNSDVITWHRDPKGEFIPTNIEKAVVGHHISTKAVGSDKREDITHLYKLPEGSKEERIVVETASRHGTKPKLYASPSAQDVSMEVKMEGEGPMIGEDARLKIVVKNKSSQYRSTTLHSEVAVMYYTGVLKDTVKEDKLPVKLKPNEVKTIDWVLPYQHYKHQLMDHEALMLTLCGRVSETLQILSTQFNFRLCCPDLRIKPVGVAKVGEEMLAEITFTNPLPCTLTGGEIVLVGSGLGLQKVPKVVIGEVRSHSTVTVKAKLIPSQTGTRKLVAILNCKQLTHINGVADVIVQEK